MFTSDDL